MHNEFRNTSEVLSLLFHVLEELICRIHKVKLRKKMRFKLLRCGWGLFSLDSPGLSQLGVGVFCGFFFPCGIVDGACG